MSLFLDLSAVFDTINHSILLDRLSKWFGLHGAVLNWVKSYLSNRLFQFKCSDQLSEPHHSSYGVPQGSVLGPLLFSLYTTPLSSLISSLSVSHHLYADDTQLFLSFQHLTSMKTSLTYRVHWVLLLAGWLLTFCALIDWVPASWSSTSTQQNSQSCVSFQQ